MFVSAFFDVPKDDIKYALRRTNTNTDPIITFMINNFFTGLLVMIALIYVISYVRKFQDKRN